MLEDSIIASTNVSMGHIGYLGLKRLRAVRSFPCRNGVGGGGTVPLEAPPCSLYPHGVVTAGPMPLPPPPPLPYCRRLRDGIPAVCQARTLGRQHAARLEACSQDLQSQTATQCNNPPAVHSDCPERGPGQYHPTPGPAQYLPHPDLHRPRLKLPSGARPAPAVPQGSTPGPSPARVRPLQVGPRLQYRVGTGARGWDSNIGR